MIKRRPVTQPPARIKRRSEKEREVELKKAQEKRRTQLFRKKNKSPEEWVELLGLEGFSNMILHEHTTGPTQLGIVNGRDMAYVVMEGKLKIRLRGMAQTIKEGKMRVVPKTIHHSIQLFSRKCSYFTATRDS